ncbi:DUF5723 family protein [Flavobacterium sp. '19STA2R22 D10 B1']|uniref:DUF5723 family protein n=1 Tax=Flavobacterium aerium TaxID=3037261 RepID=UPI00278C213B|nr:DUF5723 family protein [Flavobacterium sp. '19STA2R22 D10 B1']
MERIMLLFCFFGCTTLLAQGQFTGINTSQKGGHFSTDANPAELLNSSTKYSFTIFGLSANASNNKVGLLDVFNKKDLEDILLEDNKGIINLRFDTEIIGPGFAVKLKKWAFSVGTKTYAKGNAIRINTTLGNVIHDKVNGVETHSIENLNNQRINATAWSEIGFTIARTISEDKEHKFNIGTTLKLLFPGTYGNIAAQNFRGTLVYSPNSISLTNTTAQLDIAYSEKLANGIPQAGEYIPLAYGKLNGFAIDFGINYMWKDDDENDYLANTGIAVRNLGSMTFSSHKNSFTSYRLNVPNGSFLQIDNFDNDISTIEQQLINSGYLQIMETNPDIKVKTPAVLAAYLSLKIIPKWYVTLYAQGKLGNDSKNNQITTQNTFSVTPHFTTGNLEIYSPWATNEISGFTGGIGIRLGGFFIGSESIITGVVSNTKQGDIHIGYQFNFDSFSNSDDCHCSYKQ